MKNLVTNHYVIENPNITENERIAYISDIHGDYDKLYNISKELEKLKVNVLLLGGDVLDTSTDHYRNEKIRRLLTEVSKIIEIFLSIGNHELIHFPHNFFGERIEVSYVLPNYWNALSQVKNLHVSEIPSNKAAVTKWSLCNNVDICSLSLPIEYYWNQEKKIAFDDYKRAIDDIEIDTNRFNILLSHSPNNIVVNGEIDEYLAKIKKFNLILSGHMHSGLVPNFLKGDNINKGIIGPYTGMFPDNAYGMKKDDETTLIISGGVVKISRSSILGFLEKNRLTSALIDTVYPAEIEVFDLKPGEKHSIKKIKRAS